MIDRIAALAFAGSVVVMVTAVAMLIGPIRYQVAGITSGFFDPRLLSKSVLRRGNGPISCAALAIASSLRRADDAVHQRDRHAECPSDSWASAQH